MEVIQNSILKKGLVNHPYDTNLQYFAKVNIFYKSHDRKFTAGYWEAPEGWFDATIIGFNEIDFIIEGEIEAISEDKIKKVTARKGDCFLIKNGDRFRWQINKFTKAVFFIYPLTEELDKFFNGLIR